MTRPPAFTVPGHTLAHRGLPVTSLGLPVFRDLDSSNKSVTGFAKCSCGEVSFFRYPTAAARKQWHYEHKFVVDPDRSTTWLALRSKWLTESFWKSLTLTP